MSHAIKNALRIAVAKTETDPSVAQKEAGNYAKGKVDIHGLKVAIENPKGSERFGTDKGGKTWRVKMPSHYGYVLGTEGRDGDHVDVYIGPDHDSKKVFVVDQVNAENGRFDEHKAMLSYPSKAAALADYQKAFSDGKAKDRIGSVTEMSVDEFRSWVKSGDTKKPLGELRQSYASGGKVDFDMGNSRDKIAAAIALSMGRPGFAEGGPATDALDEALRSVSPRSIRSDDLGLAMDMPDGELRNAGRYSPVRPLSERALSALFDYGPAPAKIATEIAMQPVRAGEAIGEAAFDPTLPNVGNAAFQSGLAVFKPMHAFKALGLGNLLTIAKDAGLTPFGEAHASDDGLTPAQNKRLSDLQAKSGKGGLTRAEREEQNSYLNIQRDYMGAQAAAKARAEEKEKGLEAEAKAAKAKGQEDEYQRSVKHAEQARAEELSRVRRFSETETGKLWEKTGGLAPALAGIGLGGLTRAASGGGSALKDYVAPMLSGALGGGLLSNLPLAYDSFSTETENPERRAYEAYSRELPPSHPRKQEWQDYARGLPEKNPLRKTASEEFYDPVKAAERILFGALEGAGGGLAGGELMRLPKRAVDVAAGLPGRYGELKAAADARASEARGVASAARRDAAQSDALALRSQSDAALSQADAVQSALALAEQKKLLRQAERQSSGQGIGDLEGLARTSRQSPSAAPSESQLPSLPPLQGTSIIDDLRAAGPAALPENIGAGRVVHDISPQAEAVLEKLFAQYSSAAPRSMPAETFRDFKKVAPGEGKWATDIAPTARDVMLRRAEEGAPMWPKKGQAIHDEIGGALPSGTRTNITDVRDRLANMYDQLGTTTPTRAQLEKFFADSPGSLSKGRKVFSSLPIAAGLGYGMSGDEAEAGPASKTIIKTKHPNGHWQHRNEDGTFTSLPGSDDGKANGGRIKAALDAAKRYATGGRVHSGAVVGDTGGRTDALPISVAAGSFVIPADIVSSVGEGNTLAGVQKLEATFGKPLPRAAMASGGSAVPIRISDGEFVLSPDQVAKIGDGDMDRGHKVLDALVLKLRHDHINTLKSLPPPSR